jgi:hypothetical protein
MRLAAPLLAALVAWPPALAAQRLAAPQFAPVDLSLTPPRNYAVATEAIEDADPGPGIAGLVLLGVAGGVAGGVLGARVGGSSAYVDGDPGVLYGFLVGESLGLALAVHLANGSHGGVGKSTLAALAIASGGVAAAALADRGVVLLAVPILQLAAVIGIERRERARVDADPI